MIGTIIGNYRIVEKLGAGGMGEVYRAVDTVLEREVALKSLHPFLTQDDGRLERFRSEAVTLARLNHPNIAILHNFFNHNDVYYMVMEYVQGENFESLIRRFGRVPLRRTLEMFIESLKGFEHAHAKQVIHRDIKPANLMLNAENVVKITDFGIARVVGGERLTQTGKLIGTLEYMSPEQVRGQEQDARSDIYSLGILLYEMVAGQVPFSSESDFEIMRSHLEASPRSMRDFSADLPAGLEDIIAKALEKDPANRYASARDFRLALEPVLAAFPAAAPQIVPQIRPTREADVAALLPPVLAGPTGAASPPPARTNFPIPALAGRLPSWLKPRIAIAGAVAVLLLVMFSAAAMHLRTAPDSSKANADVALVNTGTVDEDSMPAGISSDDAAFLTPVDTEPLQPPITPITPVVATPTPKPVPKPTATPAPKPAPKPTPKPVVRKARVRRAASKSSTSQLRASRPRRATPVKRKAAPKRAAPAKRSKPSSSGGGGSEAALRDAIKNN